MKIINNYATPYIAGITNKQPLNNRNFSVAPSFGDDLPSDNFYIQENNDKNGLSHKAKIGIVLGIISAALISVIAIAKGRSAK